MIKKIDHVVITTSNIEACLSFYKKIGFEIKEDDRYELFAGDFKINVHVLGNELLPHAKHVQAGSADLCFEINGNIEDYKRELIHAGLEIELGSVLRYGVKGMMNSIYLRDPDGNLIELNSYE